MTDTSTNLIKTQARSNKIKIANRRIDIRLLVGWWVVLLATLFVFLYQPNIQELFEIGKYLGLWLIIGLACLYFIKRWSYSSKLGLPFDFLEIPIYLSFTLLVLMSLFGIAPYLDEDYLLNQLLSVSELPQGLLLTGIGLISLWVGYAVGVILLPQYVSQNPIDRSRKIWINFHNPSFIKTIATYLAIAVIRVILIFLGGGEGYEKNIQLGGWAQWVTYLVETRWLFIALFVLQSAKGKWPRPLPVLVVLFEIFVAVFSGWTSSLLKIGFLVVGCFKYYGKRFSIYAWFLLIFLSFLLPPISRASRNLDFSSSRSFFNSLGSAFEGRANRNSISFTQDLLVNRQTTIAQTQSVILRFTPSIFPYRPIDELLWLPFSVIPRVLWSSKPIVGGLGVYINMTFLEAPATTTTSAALTMPGNAYLYGGWTAVIVIMTAIGILLALFYRAVAVPARINRQVGLLALYAGTMIAVFHIGETDFLGVWSGLVQRGVVFFLVLVFLCMNKHTTTRQALSDELPGSGDNRHAYFREK